MVAVFPLGKLLYLGVKQLSKPIARQLQNAAVRSPFFKKYICAPPAQLVHRLEMFVKMRTMGVKGPTHVHALKEEQAAQIGADLIGEMFVYSIAAAAILFEYWRSSRKEQEKDISQDEQILALYQRVTELNKELKDVKTKVSSLEQSPKRMTSKA